MVQLTGNYKILHDRLMGSIDKTRMYSDPLYTLAYGTDASFYRLIPKIVILAINEEEVTLVLKLCSELSLPVTFRAAGTSLSGQAVSDSVLLLAGSHWNKFRINENASEIWMQPGLTGGKVNALLGKYGRKIGPDPASVNSAMIGGIAANNASGMCCGTAENTYKTVTGMRLIMADGSTLDTRSAESKNAFNDSHPKILSDLAELALSAKNNSLLAERIRKKYKMKNTTGYSLNALIDFDEPFDILMHLMVGSEGTLGFIADISLRTIIEPPHRASSLMIFPDIEKACQAIPLLKNLKVSAAELLDRAALRSVENEKGTPVFLKSLNDNVCALLVETTALDKDILNRNIETIKYTLTGIEAAREIIFTDIPAEYEVLWKIRKGLFPSVGAMRKTGTTVIIEDIAFPIDSLAEATIDLRKILKKFGYENAVIFGHALEGNLHFVFTQDFNIPQETERYAGLMKEVSELVVNKYDGSLKAEHGTGRNMAPFVELEWGNEAYILMKRIKNIFDPTNILNPGVILNNDKQVHLKNLKPLPAADDSIDKCTECGFCESSCVSAGLTLSPRQRITVHRKIVSLQESGNEPHIAAALMNSFTYAGKDTCATDGLCALNCPVKIDTGRLIKNLRSSGIARKHNKALWMADHMKTVTWLGGKMLSVISFFHILFGTRAMIAISRALRKVSGKRIPAWNPGMPAGAKPIIPEIIHSNNPLRVVYFPSCINRAMGISRDHSDNKQLSETMCNLLHKANYEIIYPDNLGNLCCGMAFSSKGYAGAGKKKSDELERSLKIASRYGEYPVLCDMSPCLFTMQENFDPVLKLYEPASFIIKFLLPHLNITRIDEAITVFAVCSMKKMGLDDSLIWLANLCAREVIVPETNCCGFAGDRGFTFPELNKYGLRELKNQLHENVKHGYSTSRTCEIGLSSNSGISYKSIVYLVDQVSSPKGTEPMDL